VYCPESSDEWKLIHDEDLWIYNKLFLSRILGYTCGPIGVQVPKSDFYIVRPSFNLLGMGRFARIEWIESSTDHLHPSEFWCEIFDGEHLSVDFKNKVPELVVLGERDSDEPLYKWKKWSKINKNINFPEILNRLRGNYEYINCEFIGNRLIEVHFRQNPDFRFQNSVAIPNWTTKELDFSENYTYISDPDYLRSGFWIK
jgi:hypothetical protein